jgi:hypothetical protein
MTSRSDADLVKRSKAFVSTAAVSSMPFGLSGLAGWALNLASTMRLRRVAIGMLATVAPFAGPNDASATSPEPAVAATVVAPQQNQLLIRRIDLTEMST